MAVAWLESSESALIPALLSVEKTTSMKNRSDAEKKYSNGFEKLLQ